VQFDTKTHWISVLIGHHLPGLKIITMNTNSLFYTVKTLKNIKARAGNIRPIGTGVMIKIVSM